MDTYYVIKKAKDQITEIIRTKFPDADIEITAPPPELASDFAVPLFKLAKKYGKSPNHIHEEIESIFDKTGTLFDSVFFLAGYINFVLNQMEYFKYLARDALRLKNDFGKSNTGTGQSIVIDYSAPNIAKPFSIGHLRSTIIGQSLYNIFGFLGYAVTGINHLGDWGTQFGKLLYAFDNFRKKNKTEDPTIGELLDLYVLFHKKAEKEPELEDKARDYFMRLEKGDKECRKKWETFCKISLDEFKRVYTYLGGIRFDEYLGESFFFDKGQVILDEILSRRFCIFDSQEKYESFLNENGEIRSFLEKSIQSINISTPVFFLTDKGHTKAAGRISDNEKAAEFKALIDVKIKGQNKVLEKLRNITGDETQAKEILKQFESENIKSTVYWIETTGLTEKASGKISGEAQKKLQSQARCLASTGSFLYTEGDEDSGTETAKQENLLLVDLTDFGIDTPLLLQKKDGTTLYALRDLAAIKYRTDSYNPTQILYVVGSEQSLHFRQIFMVARLLGYETQCHHIDFGLYRFPEGKMSTRKGRIILLENILNEAVEKALEIIKDREIPENEKKEIARIVGIGSIKYTDLSQERRKEIVFDWAKMLNMDGNSAPYLQYTYVRIVSILNKAGTDPFSHSFETEVELTDKEHKLIMSLSRFPEILEAAARTYAPHIISGYLYSLSQDFNNFYNSTSVIRTEEADLRTARLLLCRITSIVIKNGLMLLGIEVPNRM
ncbi:MAG: arginine--tRNA ligase [Spirochaetales bacterium]|nr:arginine--tRNA ligase [Spirochaetales bacterium]